MSAVELRTKMAAVARQNDALRLFMFGCLFPQCDLASEGFLGNVNQLDDYCRDKNFHAWFETSAKENLGIDEAARCLVAKVRQLTHI